jgi:hypothetical protein
MPWRAEGQAVEPKDETDGTPEWAKRMFAQLRNARWYLILFTLFVAVPAYGAYRLFEAATLGRIWHERSDRWISYASDPNRFLLEVGGYLIAVSVPLLFLGIRAKYPSFARRIIESIRPR